jgi:hypothetical protein
MKLASCFMSAIFWGATTVSALPTVLKAESCVCELDDSVRTGTQASLSCSAKAAEISKWRLLAFHRPELADAMVDTSEIGGENGPLRPGKFAVPAVQSKMIDFRLQTVPHALFRKSGTGFGTTPINMSSQASLTPS